MNTLTKKSWLRWLEATALVRPVPIPYCPHTPVAPCAECEARAGEGGGE